MVVGGTEAEDEEAGPAAAKGLGFGIGFALVPDVACLFEGVALVPALRCRSAAAGRFNVAPVAAGPGPGTGGAEVAVLVAMVGPVAAAVDGGGTLLRPAEGEGSMTDPLTSKFVREYPRWNRIRESLTLFWLVGGGVREKEIDKLGIKK